LAIKIFSSTAVNVRGTVQRHAHASDESWRAQ